MQPTTPETQAPAESAPTGYRSKAFAFLPHHSEAVRRLIEAGIIPHDCTRFELFAAVGEVVAIRTESYLSHEDFELLSKVLAEHPEEAARMARSMTLVDRSTDEKATVEEL